MTVKETMEKYEKKMKKTQKDEDSVFTSNYLIHEIPTGTDIWHFRHSTDKKNGICMACCVLGLVRLPVFSTQGGSGKSPGINARPPIYTICIKKSLKATLKENWQPHQEPLGYPEWEKPMQEIPPKSRMPLLMGLTWLPRRVWLGTPAKSKESCISCGTPMHLIKRCIFYGKGSLKEIGYSWDDPHVKLLPGQKKEDKHPAYSINALNNQDANAKEWIPLAEIALNNPYSGSRRSVCFSSDQNKYFEVTERTTPTMVSGLSQEIGIQMVRKWQGEVNLQRKKIMLVPPWFIERKIKQIEQKQTNRKYQDYTAALASIRPHVEHRVSKKIDKLLSGDDAAWQEAADAYIPMMKVIAKSLSPGFTIAAVERRRQIASAKPDIWKEEDKKEPLNAKEGGQE